MGRFANPVSHEVYDPEVRAILEEGRSYLVGRQVPSCSLLCSLGTRISVKDAEVLKETGFPLLKRRLDGSWERIKQEVFLHSAVSADQKSFLSDLLKEHSEWNDSFGMENPSYEESESPVSDVSSEPDDEEEEVNHWHTYRFEYSDPFKINAAAVLAEKMGRRPLKICSWPGGVKRLQDKIPVRCLGGKWDGSVKRGIPFHEIANPDVQWNVLVRHTHWGKLLGEMCAPGGVYTTWALTLKRRIMFFLKGKHDPSWNSTEVSAAYGPSYIRRPHRSRSLRFLQVLQTIDGMFLQIYLSDITAAWNWSIFDRFVLRNLDVLLDDEFLDGETTLMGELPVTHYEKLKAFRGALKGHFLSGVVLDEAWWSISICQPYRNLVDNIDRVTERFDRVQKTGIVTQTRGCGTPPPLVVLKSKEKFLRTIAETNPDITIPGLAAVWAVTEDLLNDFPDYVFSGLKTKAGIHITTSACMENLRSEGGTTEHIRSLVREGGLGRPVPIRDLESGGLERMELYSNLTPGEYIFWRCLEDVLATNPDELRKAHLVMVREPGKARTVTKGHAALKVILDLVNSICSYPLKKGMESSQSGMAKANHGWNLFMNLMGPWRDQTFEKLSSSTEVFGPTDRIETVEFKDLWIGFTDYSEATDKMDHRVARIVGDAWMNKCGLPRVLRGIVHAVCYNPRTITFSATGRLSLIGEPTDTEGVRKVLLRQGVLMGDPLTKVVLHLCNAGVRRFGAMGQTIDLCPFAKVSGEDVYISAVACLGAEEKLRRRGDARA